MKIFIIFFLFLLSNYSLATDLVGTGASFPYKFLNTAFNEYEKNKKSIKIKYTPTGSKVGYESLKNQNVDFSAVDMYLKDELLNTFPEPKEILHIPICLSGIGIAYNIKNIETLNLSAKVISEILIRNIKKWNDEKIKELNPDVDLPDLDIIVILRKSGSGSTYLLTKYLTKFNNLWRVSFGTSLEINFPGCILADNSQQMQKLLAQIPGSFGYIAYSYKDKSKFNFAAIENNMGNFIAPTTESITDAANIDLPKDSRASLVDSKSEKGYPLSSFSWIITYKNQSYKNRNKKTYEELKKLLSWIVNEGQIYNLKTGYSPLPKKAKTIANNILDEMNFKKVKNQ